MRTLLATCSLLVATMLAPAPVLAQASGPVAAPEALEVYVDAMTAFREHRYSAAYGRFMRLADSGHEASAQMALMMFRNGPSLFAAEWEATDVQLAKWSSLVVTAERESNDFLRVSAR